MILGARTEYALLALIDLVQQRSGQTTSEAIAERQAIPMKYLPQIMSDLTRAGFVRSIRGARGGVRLAPGSERANILEISEAVQGPFYFYNCLHEGVECKRGKGCGVNFLLANLQSRVAEYLKKTSLEEVVRAHKRKPKPLRSAHTGRKR
jgi:Rrf2 family cysteine metabolism transcriptional repressor